MPSRERQRQTESARWKQLAERGHRRVGALLYAVSEAQRHTEVDIEPIRDVLTAELESARYHEARSMGKTHEQAMAYSREGRRQIAQLLG